MSVDQKEIKLQVLLLYSLLSVILLVLEYQTLSATFLAVEKQKVNPNENRNKSKGREGKVCTELLKNKQRKKQKAHSFTGMFFFILIPSLEEKKNITSRKHSRNPQMFY